MHKHTGDRGHSISPVTPSELLIALHSINCSNDEALMKAAIKGIIDSEFFVYQLLLDHKGNTVPLYYYSDGMGVLASLAYI